jgi:cation transport protein ChaC
VVLTRESIKNGLIQDMIAAGDGIVPMLSEKEIVASYHRTIAEGPQDQDVWVFGYGSLIWNPAFHFEEKCIARLRGYHRRFCLWTHLGRGTPDCPGMVLGLDRGGSCRGVSFRVDRKKLVDEFDVIWRREMVSGAYVPKWQNIETDQGIVPAVSFVINRQHLRYAADVTMREIVESLATATGPLGEACDYLFKTVEGLAVLGINDKPLSQLSQLVKRRREELAA